MDTKERYSYELVLDLLKCPADHVVCGETVNRLVMHVLFDEIKNKKKNKSRAINERQNGTLKGGIYFNNGTTINRTFSAFVRHQIKSNNISDITITTYESTCAKKLKSLDEIKM